MKLKKLLIAVISLSFLVGCQTVKDGIVGKKKSKSADEFLIKKKNPLVLPPDFYDLPVPTNATNKVTTEEETSIQKIIGMTGTASDLEKNKNLGGSVEDQILKKIKNN